MPFIEGAPQRIFQYQPIAQTPPFVEAAKKRLKPVEKFMQMCEELFDLKFTLEDQFLRIPFNYTLIVNGWTQREGYDYIYGEMNPPNLTKLRGELRPDGVLYRWKENVLTSKELKKNEERKRLVKCDFEKYTVKVHGGLKNTAIVEIDTLDPVFQKAMKMFFERHAALFSCPSSVSPLSEEVGAAR